MLSSIFKLRASSQVENNFAMSNEMRHLGSTMCALSIHIWSWNKLELYVQHSDWYDPGNEKTIRFGFWRKMRNYLISRQQS